MKKPNWVCSNCSMWSSRKSSVKRHIQNVHRGNSNLVSFIDYLVGRKSGLYFPNPRPTYEKKSGIGTTTVTVFDTFKNEFWKSVASQAANKVLSPSSSSAAVQINQQQYLSNFQGFGSNGAPYFNPNQFHSEPSTVISKPEEIFGFEIYACKNCSSLVPVIVSFNDGENGGSKIISSPCCSTSALRKPDQNIFNGAEKIKLQKIQDT